MRGLNRQGVGDRALVLHEELDHPGGSQAGWGVQAGVGLVHPDVGHDGPHCLHGLFGRHGLSFGDRAVLAARQQQRHGGANEKRRQGNERGEP